MTRTRMWITIPLIISCFIGGIAHADAKHGIAMYGEPALPQDFVSLPYANPDAPKGGRITIGERGSFDSLHPFILKGKAPYGVSSTHSKPFWDDPMMNLSRLWPISRIGRSR